MKHIQVTTSTVPRQAADVDCCDCLERTGNDLSKCVKQGQCPSGWTGDCVSMAE